MGFAFWDYVVVVVYLLGIVGIGAFFMHRQEDTADYFLGGRRFHWLPVAISMFASLFSAISYIAVPAEAYNHGVMMFLFPVAVLLGVPLAVVLFVRPFRRLSLTTAYEYLEKRFSLRVRLLASLLFLLLRSSYLGVVLFASGVALHPATGWPVWVSVLVVGVVATAYTTMGGMKSVIWTDVVQFVVLFGGIVFVFGLLIADNPRGFPGIWAHARSQSHTLNQVSAEEFFSFDPFQRISLWIVIVSGVFTKLTYAGTDQVSIQRYLSTSSENDAARSVIWGSVLGIPVMLLLYATGLGLLYFYGAHPERALPGMTGDHALPHFIANELPPGMGGLVMAAILAAIMSTVDSGLNSLSACTVTDFYGRVFHPNASEVQKLRVARWTTLAWGGLAIVWAGVIMWLFGSQSDRNPLVDISNVMVNLFGGILLAVFLLGILSRRANARGVLVGAAVGLGAALAVTAPYYFRELPENAPKLSFFCINLIGCAVTGVVGYLVSLFSQRTVAGDGA